MRGAKAFVIAAALAFFHSSAGNAAVITETFPEFSGGTPGQSFTVGTVNYTIPTGDTIVSVTASGAFGNTAYSGSSASTPVIINGVQAAVCNDGFFGNDQGCLGAPWSFTFAAADFGLFAGGTATETGFFLGGGEVRLAATDLTITTRAAAVPEPGSLAILGAGLAALGLLWSRKRALG